MENNVQKEPKEIGNEVVRLIKLAKDRRAFVDTVAKRRIIS
jgi:hypothetical protein